MTYHESHASVLLEGVIVSDQFEGKYEGRMAVYPAVSWAELAKNPSRVWLVARGAVDDGAFTAYDGCQWNIRRCGAD